MFSRKVKLQSFCGSWKNASNSDRGSTAPTDNRAKWCTAIIPACHPGWDTWGPQPQDILCSIPSFLWFHGGQRVWTWRNSFGFSGQYWFRGRSLAPCFLRETQMMPRPESHLVGIRDWGVHRWPDVLHASVAGTTVERLVGYLGYLG